jgi:hypothetical protein
MHRLLIDFRRTVGHDRIGPLAQDEHANVQWNQV